MAMAKIKTDDKVRVIAGRDKGKSGRVKSVKDGRVMVEGVNIVHEYVRRNPHADEEGGIKKREAFFDVSNVRLLHPETDRPVKVGFKLLEDGRKVRIDKHTGERLDKEAK